MTPIVKPPIIPGGAAVRSCGGWSMRLNLVPAYVRHSPYWVEGTAVRRSRVCALVLTCCLLIASCGADDADRDEPSAVATAAPDGMRLVGMGRIAVAVPDSWGTQLLNDCERPSSETVWFVQPLSEAAQSVRCRGAESLRVAAVSFHDLASPEGLAVVEEFAKEDGSINGVEVMRSPSHCLADDACPYAEVVAVPKYGVAVGLMPFGQVEQDVLGTLQLLPEGYVAVPFIGYGESGGEARRAIEAAGLIARLPEDGPPYYVVGLEPAAGSVVRTGTSVTLLGGDG